MAYTIYPIADNYDLERLNEKIAKDIPKDIKNVSTLADNDPSISILRSDRYFSFAVMLPKNRYAISGKKFVKQMVRNSYEVANKWTNKDEAKTAIRAIHNLNQETQKNHFNGALLLDISYASAIAALLASYLTGQCYAEIITWISDRDPISEAYHRAYASLFSAGHVNACEQLKVKSSSTKLALVFDDSVNSGCQTWFDPLIRIPDYLCGAISSMKLEAGRFGPVRSKYKTIFESSLADNKNILICNLTIDNAPLLKYPTFIARTINVSKTPIT